MDHTFTFASVDEWGLAQRLLLQKRIGFTARVWGAEYFVDVVLEANTKPEEAEEVLREAIKQRMAKRMTKRPQPVYSRSRPRTSQGAESKSCPPPR